MSETNDTACSNSEWFRHGRFWRRLQHRNGQLIGLAPPLEREAVREIRARLLSQEERIQIADLRLARLGVRATAERFSRSASRISRELRRNGTKRTGYRPFDANRRATVHRARHDLVSPASTRTCGR